MADELDRVTLDWDQLGIPKPVNGVVSKKVINDAIRARVSPHIAEMVDAQVKKALGIKYLVKRDPESGQFSRSTDGTGQEVWEEAPSLPAFQYLIDRAADKPRQPTDVEANVSDETAKLLERLDRWKVGNRE